MKNEEWKDIPYYSGFYQVSCKGRIKSLTRTVVSSNGKKYVIMGKAISPYKTKHGYLAFKVNKNGKRKGMYVHRAVLLAFTKEEGEQVNHIDGIKTNNNIENLEWVTASENYNHALVNGLRKYAYGKKIDDMSVLTMKTLSGCGYKYSQIAKFFPITKESVANCCKGVTWKHLCKI